MCVREGGRISVRTSVRQGVRMSVSMSAREEDSYDRETIARKRDA